MVNLFTAALALGAVFTSMASATGFLPHDVLTVRDTAVELDNSVASVAYYPGSNDCTGTPVFQNLLNWTCYGPLNKDVSVKLINVNDDCQALLRPHPCSSGNTEASLMDLTNCFLISSAKTDIDLWVQCGQPKVLPPPSQQSPPPPPPEQQDPPPPPPLQGRSSAMRGSGPGN